MKITLKNIGVFKQAEYELGDFTIICGKNNTGKTYATYTLFGFFDFWKEGYQIKIDNSYTEILFEKGAVSIPLNGFVKKSNEIIKDACEEYKKYIPKMLGGQEKYFTNASLDVKIEEKDLIVIDSYTTGFKSAKNEILQIVKESGKNELSVSLLMEANEISLRTNIRIAISDAIKDIIFGKILSNSYIASVERTGAAIFMSDLDFERNRMIEALSSKDENIIKSLSEKLFEINYALPVRRNLDFIRMLERITKLESQISKMNPEIIDYFKEIVGGDYRVDREGLWFVPQKTRGVKLGMGESSSSARSLLDVGFYLKHIAQKGDLLMIDEPELNLHPENQRKLARLLVKLVNIGIKVFVTTHSDYIVKELNTLIMFNYKKESDAIKALMKKNDYDNSELISHDRIKVFIARDEPTLLEGNSKKVRTPVLVPAKYDEFYGIEAESFDETIDDMNKLQKSIIFSE